MAMVATKTFKYKRKCKLPSCRRPFKTNREWKDFHDPACQRKWQILLRQSKEQIIESLELLKVDMKKIKKKLGITKKDLEWQDSRKIIGGINEISKTTRDKNP